MIIWMKERLQRHFHRDKNYKYPYLKPKKKVNLDEALKLSYLIIMAIKKILTAPDPLLKTISKPVEKVDDEIRKLMDDMLETMYDAPGIGLAAVQVGVPLRVIVMDISWNKEDGIKEPKYFVNPVISKNGDGKISPFVTQGTFYFPHSWLSSCGKKKFPHSRLPWLSRRGEKKIPQERLMA